jgi:hypothetical protein
VQIAGRVNQSSPAASGHHFGVNLLIARRDVSHRGVTSVIAA